METLQRQDRKIEEQQKKIDQLSTGLAGLTERFQALEHAFNLQRAKALGSGPTAR